MKKFSLVVLVAALAIGGFFVYRSTLCKLDGTNVCFDSSTERFLVEEGASVSVQVENEALASYLVATWASLYPETSVEVTVRPVLSLEEIATRPTDIMVVDQTDAAYFIPDLLDMGTKMNEVVGSRIPQGLQDAINLKGFYLAQNTVKGPLFVRNQTLMDELAIAPITDFKDLFAQKAVLLETLPTVIPFSFLDQRSFYPFLTAGGWVLNLNHIGSDADYGSEEFLNGLSFISELGKQKLFKEDYKGAQIPWNYEADFYDRKAIVSVIEDREFAEQHAQGDQYIYSEFPTYNSHHLAPQAEVRGYVVSNKTAFPSAAAEVIHILRSPAAINLNEFNEYTPVYHMNHTSDLAFDTEQVALIRAYNFSDATSILGLETDPNILARSIYTEVDIMDILMRLYDGDISAEEAQIEIVARGDAWYLLHEGETEE